ncbi:hypothetical protein GJ496_000450 [Pomphorhynchus laevis]|nr:hypothetical protein GJ496_000450 [Pomphorhynchus laevis]
MYMTRESCAEMIPYFKDNDHCVSPTKSLQSHHHQLAVTPISLAVALNVKGRFEKPDQKFVSAILYVLIICSSNTTNVHQCTLQPEHNRLVDLCIRFDHYTLVREDFQSSRDVQWNYFGSDHAQLIKDTMIVNQWYDPDYLEFIDKNKDNIRWTQIQLEMHHSGFSSIRLNLLNNTQSISESELFYHIESLSCHLPPNMHFVNILQYNGKRNKTVNNGRSSVQNNLSISTHFLMSTTILIKQPPEHCIFSKWSCILRAKINNHDQFDNWISLDRNEHVINRKYEFIVENYGQQTMMSETMQCSDSETLWTIHNFCYLNIIHLNRFPIRNTLDIKVESCATPASKSTQAECQPARQDPFFQSSRNNRYIVDCSFEHLIKFKVHAHDLLVDQTSNIYTPVWQSTFYNSSHSANVHEKLIKPGSELILNCTDLFSRNFKPVTVTVTVFSAFGQLHSSTIRLRRLLTNATMHLFCTDLNCIHTQYYNPYYARKRYSMYTSSVLVIQGPTRSTVGLICPFGFNKSTISNKANLRFEIIFNTAAMIRRHFHHNLSANNLENNTALILLEHQDLNKEPIYISNVCDVNINGTSFNADFNYDSLIIIGHMDDAFTLKCTIAHANLAVKPGDIVHIDCRSEMPVDVLTVCFAELELNYLLKSTTSQDSSKHNQRVIVSYNIAHKIRSNPHKGDSRSSITLHFLPVVSDCVAPCTLPISVCLLNFDNICRVFSIVQSPYDWSNASNERVFSFFSDYLTYISNSINQAKYDSFLIQSNDHILNIRENGFISIHRLNEGFCVSLESYIKLFTSYIETQRIDRILNSVSKEVRTVIINTIKRLSNRFLNELINLDDQYSSPSIYNCKTKVFNDLLLKSAEYIVPENLIHVTHYLEVVSNNFDYLKQNISQLLELTDSIRIAHNQLINSTSFLSHMIVHSIDVTSMGTNRLLYNLLDPVVEQLVNKHKNHRNCVHYKTFSFCRISKHLNVAGMFSISLHNQDTSKTSQDGALPPDVFIFSKSLAMFSKTNEQTVFGEVIALLWSMNNGSVAYKSVNNTEVSSTANISTLSSVPISTSVPNSNRTIRSDSGKQRNAATTKDDEKLYVDIFIPIGDESYSQTSSSNVKSLNIFSKYAHMDATSFKSTLISKYLVLILSSKSFDLNNPPVVLVSINLKDGSSGYRDNRVIFTVDKQPIQFTRSKYQYFMIPIASNRLYNVEITIKQEESGPTAGPQNAAKGNINQPSLILKLYQFGCYQIENTVVLPVSVSNDQYCNWINATNYPHYLRQDYYLGCRCFIVPGYNHAVYFEPISLMVSYNRNISSLVFISYLLLLICFCVFIVIYSIILDNRLKYTDQIIQRHNGVISLAGSQWNAPYFYQITIFTGLQSQAGLIKEGGQVYVSIIGVKHSSPPVLLNRYNLINETFKRGGADAFLITSLTDLGDIKAIRFKLGTVTPLSTSGGLGNLSNNKNNRLFRQHQQRQSKWYIRHCVLNNLRDGNTYYFCCYSWLTNAESSTVAATINPVDLTLNSPEPTKLFPKSPLCDYKSFGHTFSQTFAWLFFHYHCMMSMFTKQPLSHNSRIHRSCVCILCIFFQLLFIFEIVNSELQQRYLRSAAMASSGTNWKSKLPTSEVASQSTDSFLMLEFLSLLDKVFYCVIVCCVGYFIVNCCLEYISRHVSNYMLAQVTNSKPMADINQRAEFRSLLESIRMDIFQYLSDLSVNDQTRHSWFNQIRPRYNAQLFNSEIRRLIVSKDPKFQNEKSSSYATSSKTSIVDDDRDTVSSNSSITTNSDSVDFGNGNIDNIPSKMSNSSRLTSTPNESSSCSNANSTSIYDDHNLPVNDQITNVYVKTLFREGTYFPLTRNIYLLCRLAQFIVMGGCVFIVMLVLSVIVSRIVIQQNFIYYSMTGMMYIVCLHATSLLLLFVVNIAMIVGLSIINAGIFKRCEGTRFVPIILQMPARSEELHSSVHLTSNLENKNEFEKKHRKTHIDNVFFLDQSDDSPIFKKFDDEQIKNSERFRSQNHLDRRSTSFIRYLFTAFASNDNGIDRRNNLGSAKPFYMLSLVFSVFVSVKTT